MAGRSDNSMGVSSINTLLDYAKYYRRIGLSVIPLKPSSKIPVFSWKEYQERLPSMKEIEEWFKDNNKNIAIVTGIVSGNLVVIDFDNKELFEEFIKKVSENDRLRNSLANTWIVKTGKGYHIYVRLEDPSLVPRTKPRLREGLDIKAEGGYVVAPPSLHPSGAKYEFGKTSDGEIFGPPDNPEPIVLTEREWKEILRLLGYREKQGIEKPSGPEKTLDEKEIVQIVELLKPAYVKGQRDYVVLYLSGWLRKANVRYDDARKIIELLATGDEEYNHRIYVLDRTYGLRGNPPTEEELKGKTGLQELLENTLGEEKALEIIRRIEEILGVSSPFRDSIFEILDYEKQLYAVANLRKLVIVRARRKDDRIVYKERITIGAPTSVIVYVNPLGGITKYQVVWEAITRPKKLVIGPAQIEDIIDRLRAEGLIINRRLAYDVIPAIVEGYIRKRKAEIKEEIEAPGFYYVNNRIIAVRVDVEEPPIEDLKQAAELLNELATKWYNHVIDRFSLVIKWGVIAPFIYIYKQKGKWVKWLYLYGSSYTGKSTLGEIVLNIWGLDTRHKKTGASIDTPARIGYVLSQSTFPILVNEPGNAIYREDIIEILKNAIESLIVRGKYVRGTYTEIPSLAPLIISSNKVLPKDDALLRRLYVLRFTYGERIDPEKAREFEEKVKPKLPTLSVIGKYVAYMLMNKPELLEYDWETLATALLINMYKKIGVEPPAWITMEYETSDSIYDDMVETIRGYLVKKINDEYTRFVGKVIIEGRNEEGNPQTDEIKFRSEIPFEQRIRIVLENNLLPWAYTRDDKIIITTPFMHEIRPLIGDIGGLKSVAELLGWEYKRAVKIGKRAVQGILVNINEFIEFLAG